MIPQRFRDDGLKIAYAQWVSMDCVEVALTADWKLTGLPPLRWGHHGMKKVPILRPDCYAFGRRSGYFIKKNWITFVLDPEEYPENRDNILEHEFFVAGNFNDWDPFAREKWKLSRTTVENSELFTLNVGLKDLPRNGQLQFKFAASPEVWLEIPETAPNTVVGYQGIRNFELRPWQSGLHLFHLSPEETFTEAHDEVVCFRSQEYTESVSILPGQFFYSLGSELPMGVILDGDTTTFRVFAPRATAVTVELFTHQKTRDLAEIQLEHQENGIWEITCDGIYDGFYYWIRVDGDNTNSWSNFDAGQRLVDPYAVAQVGPAGPGIIRDLRHFESLARAFHPPAWQDLVILECHLRDLQDRARIDLNPHERRSFAGLKQWLENDVNYIKELGVNAVELQPLMEYEGENSEIYQWGYMPVSFMAPASHYSLDALKGGQVEELRELVATFHKQGLAVILDVVYNHTGSPNHLSFMDKLYYFDLDEGGNYVNWSGCGNTFRSPSRMATRLIVDSLKHLVRTYGIDGFRFDLAELIGAPVLREIEKELKTLKPDIILIAEPWSFRGHIIQKIKKTGFTSWNDGFREFMVNYVKGKGDLDGIRYYLSGSMTHYSNWPAQSVNYVESHDDYCWIDRITENEGHDGHHPTPNDRRRTHLMLAILMSSLGIPMLAEGQDMLRSKRGIHNTYLRGDLNALDYERMRLYSGTHEYFRRWIRFRLSARGLVFRLFSPPDVDYFSYFEPENGEGSAIGVLYNAAHRNGPRRAFFAVNPHEAEVVIDTGTLSSADWMQIADHERFDEDGLKSARFLWRDSQLCLPPLTCGLWIEP